MPPAYVKPYVKRQKNDVADAEAICEAVTQAEYAILSRPRRRSSRAAWCFIARGICSFGSRPR